MDTINTAYTKNLVAGARYNIRPVDVPAARTHYAKDPYILMAFNSRAAILSDENSICTCILLHRHRFKIVNR